MNIDVITEEDQKQLSDLITELKPEVDTKTELQSDDWLCLICNKKITTDKARFLYNDQSEFQFINPDGFVFDIITLADISGHMQCVLAVVLISDGNTVVSSLFTDL